MAQMPLPAIRTYRSKTTVVMAATGPTKTDVDVTSLGLPALTKCYARLVGFTITNNTPNNASARLRLSSNTNLEIYTECQAACTMVVYWEIAWASYLTVRRGVAQVTLNAGTGQGTATVDFTPPIKSTARAFAFCNGATLSTSAVQPTFAAVEFSDLDTLALAAYNVNGGGNAADVAWVVVSW